MPEDSGDADIVNYVRMRGGLNDTERAARFLQLTGSGAGPDDPAPTATAVFEAAGAGSLARAAAMWRDVHGITCLVGDKGSGAAGSGPRIRSLVAETCGYGDFDTVKSAISVTASRAAAEIETVFSRR